MAYELRSSLKKLRGVKEVKTSLAKRTLTITFDEKEISTQRLLKFIRDLGYLVKEVSK